MAKKVVWTHGAVGDLNFLASYIAKDSPAYAASFVQKILDMASSLDKLSARGRIVPEHGNSKIREVFISDYRLIYRIESKRVAILAIIHGKRNLKTT